MTMRAEPPAPKKVNARRLVLDGITLNARALRDTERTLTILMVRADKIGIPQTAVAKAAGVSQAHVSRTLAAERKRAAARKPPRAAKRGEPRGSV
jgi:hypothetical protein